MRTITKITGLMLFTAMLLSLIVFFASFKTKDVQSERRILIDQMIRFADDRIIPVMEPVRRNFEEVLNEADRIEIENARNALREILEIRQSQSLMPGQILDPDRKLTREESELVRTTRNQFRLEMARVRVIADKYENEINRALDPVSPQFDDWRIGLESIVADHLSVGFGVSKLLAKASPIRKLRLGRDYIPMVFLIYDPDKSLAGLKSAKTKMEEKSFTFRVFPNPVENQCCVELDLSEDSHVLLMLCDSELNVIDEHHFGHLHFGNHTKCFTLDNSYRGIAYLKLTIDDKEAVRSIIIK